MMAVLDLLGRRWALRVIWELRDGKPQTFRELQKRCDGMSSSVLAQRLSELGEAGIVAVGDAGYSLSREGASLIEALDPLQDWSKRWGRRVSAGARSR